MPTAKLTTIGATLDRYSGIGPGFDFLRVALAMMIVLNHSFLIVDGSYAFVNAHHLWTLFGTAVPMFFALSGFLIAGSAQRLKLHDFLLNRGMRIVPALAVDIFVSALVIGPIVTTVDLSTYVADSKFHHYFLNIIGFIHYELPGVFQSNPFKDQVNGSLWTVPFEIGCYAIIASLMLAGALQSKRKALGVFIGFVLCFIVMKFFLAGKVHSLAFLPSYLANYLNNFISDRGGYLYFYFLGGIMTYLFRDRIPYNAVLALVAAALIFFAGADIVHLGKLKPLLMSMPTAYLTVYIGLQPIGKLPLYSRGDYSYGIYLYGFPLQQILVWTWPGRFTVATHFLASVFCATLVAMISWHCIEKPVLRLRRKFSFTARKGDEAAAQTSSPEPASQTAMQ